ncbi:MAG: hypothetical protein NTV32_02445 [Gammaproteobacteria bacterium]|nr:hypothetical protein [Gammaproteobacteria bacterium]
MFASNTPKSLLGLALLALWSTQAMAAPKAALQALLPQVQALSQEQSVVAAVNAANSTHATLSKTEIRTLGRQWHEGLQGKPSAVLTTVNGSALTQELQSMVAGSKGVYTGILVTDQKGLIIGQTYHAKHYAEDGQGFMKKINKDGASAVYYGKPAKDATGNGSIGVPVMDQGKVIGAILVNMTTSS